MAYINEVIVAESCRNGEVIFASTMGTRRYDYAPPFIMNPYTRTGYAPAFKFRVNEVDTYYPCGFSLQEQRVYDVRPDLDEIGSYSHSDIGVAGGGGYWSVITNDLDVGEPDTLKKIYLKVRLIDDLMSVWVSNDEMATWTTIFDGGRLSSDFFAPAAQLAGQWVIYWNGYFDPTSGGTLEVLSFTNLDNVEPPTISKTMFNGVQIAKSYLNGRTINQKAVNPNG